MIRRGLWKKELLKNGIDDRHSQVSNLRTIIESRTAATTDFILINTTNLTIVWFFGKK